MGGGGPAGSIKKGLIIKKSGHALKPGLWGQSKASERTIKKGGENTNRAAIKLGKERQTKGEERDIFLAKKGVGGRNPSAQETTDP